MPTYVLLTRLASDAIVDPNDLTEFNSKIKKRVRTECKGVEWTAGYVLLGQYDALDIFSAPDNETASKVALIVRSFGHAITEVLPATVWSDLEKVVGQSREEPEDAGEDVGESGENLGQGVAPKEDRVGIGGSMEDHEDAEKSIEDEVDEAMVESFPASDPPSFNPGQTD